MGRVIAVSGPSGVGKGTVIRELQKLYKNYAISISVTSREPRKGEIEGVHYFFRSKPEFEKMIEDNQFVEWDVYVGNYYGTSKPFIKDLLAEGKDVLLDITYKGAFEIRKNFQECILVFVLPPSFKDLRKRLAARGTENAKAVKERLIVAESEMEFINHFDYYVINDNVKAAAKKIRSIIVAEECKIRNDMGETIKRIVVRK
jgi:guanylate kinase